MCALLIHLTITLDHTSDALTYGNFSSVYDRYIFICFKESTRDHDMNWKKKHCNLVI